MTGRMKILVPVDGSGCSMEGVKVASQYGRTKGFTALYIMAVIPYFADIDLELSASDRSILAEGIRRRGEDILEKAKGLMESYGVTNIRTVLSSSSSPADEIVTFAEAEDIDLIVIGSRGPGSTARFLLGSVAAHLVMHSPSCVYVVKERCCS